MTRERGITVRSVLAFVLVSPLLAVLAVGLEFALVRVGLGLGVILLAGPTVLTIACVLAGMCWAAALSAALDPPRAAPRKLLIIAGSIAFVMASFRVIHLFGWLGLSELEATAPLLGLTVGVMAAGPITAPPRRLVVALGIGAVLGLALAWWLAPGAADDDEATWIAPRVALVLLHGVFAVEPVGRYLLYGPEREAPPTPER